MISDVLEDQLQLNDVGIIKFFKSPFRNIMLSMLFWGWFSSKSLSGLGFSFGRAFLFLDHLLGQCLSRPVCSSSFSIRAGARLVVRYLQNVNMDMFVLRVCMQGNCLIVMVYTVHRSVGSARKPIRCF